MTPEGWELEIADALCSKITKGATPPKEEILPSGSIPFLRVNNLTPGGSQNIEGDMIFVTNKYHEKFLSRSISLPDDILINIVGPPLGKSLILGKIYTSYNVNQAIVIFRARRDRVDPLYLYFQINSSPARNWLETQSKKTSGQQNLTIETCKALPLLVPPLREQQRIVEILFTWDRAIETVEALIANARAEKRALMDSLTSSRQRLPGFVAAWEASAVQNPDLKPRLLEGPSTLKIIDDKTSKPPKCYHDAEGDVVDWILAPLPAEEREAFQAFDPKDGKHSKSRHKSLDCSIMDAADDIAYGVHDLEDAIALKLISKDAFVKSMEGKCLSFLDALKQKYPDESQNDVFSRMVDGLFGDSGDRKHYINRLVHHFVTAIEYVEQTEFSEPLLRYRVQIKSAQRAFLDALQELVVKEVIRTPGVQHLEFKGQGMVVSVFEAMQADPERLLPRDALKRFQASNNDIRAICDYVAGMTDTYLLRTYERLFSPRMGSVFDKL